MSQLSRKEWFLLLFLTVCWGLSWPIMKFGIRYFPPITFRTLGLLAALPILFIFARSQHASLAIPKGHLLSLIKLSIPNVLVWNTMIILGIGMLSSGRAAILGYTMPIWAVLAGFILYKDKLSPMAWLGVICAGSGAILLLSGEFSNIAGKPLGTILVLIGACSWGYGTVEMRKTVLAMPSISVTFWMIAISAIPLTIYTVIFEHSKWHQVDAWGWATIAYNGLMVFGMANIIWIQMARKLPPVVSSLSVMMIPVVGVFSGTLLLAEAPRWQDYAALVLILASMSTVLLKPSRNHKEAAEDIPRKDPQ